MLSKAVRVQNKNLVKAAVVSFHLLCIFLPLHSQRSNPISSFFTRVDRKRILGFRPQHPNHFP